MATASLEYLEDYRVLLCFTCSYCVSREALDRHLKDIHHMPATERKHHVDNAYALDLADPDEVVYPEGGQASLPVACIPVNDGFACQAPECEHLCVTFKRMKAHWRTKHSCGGNASREGTFRCRRVKLQTFFRGKALRYFIVADTRQKRCNEPSKSKNSSSLTKPRGLKPIQCSSTSQNFEEWLLIQHFYRGYKNFKPCTSSRESWRDQILQACVDVDYLRFALLSLAASNIAFEYPESRQLYGAEANKYRGKAISSLTSGSVEVNLDNFFAVFNFSRFMTVVYLATIQLNEATGDKRKSVLPEWVPIQLNGRALVWRFRGGDRIAGAMHGPGKQLRLANLMREDDMQNNPFDNTLAELELALEVGEWEHTDSVSLEALRTLRRAWAVPYGNSAVSFRDVALMWIVRVPVKYLDLVKDAEDPVALVVFAHFCALWSLAECEYWYMVGHARSILSAIENHLDHRWKSWISWPRTLVNAQPLSPSPATSGGSSYLGYETI